MKRRGTLTDQGMQKLANPGSEASVFPTDKPLSAEHPSGSFGQDRIVQAVIAALIIASIPFLIPVLSDTWQTIYSQHLDLPFLMAAILAIRFRLRNVKEDAEHRFWNLLTFGLAWWLAALVMGPIATVLLTDSVVLGGFVMNAPFLMLYGAIAVALEIHPHVRRDPVTHYLRTLNRAGAFFLLFGLLLYFLVVPGLSIGYDSAVQSSSYSLFVAFDAYIVLRLWHLRESAATREWKSLYTWLLFAVTIWAIGDFMQLLMHEHILTGPDWGIAFDLLWPLSFSAIAVATRLAVVQRSPDSEVITFYKPSGMAPLVVYALGPLVLHVSFYRFGDPDPEFRMMREILVLGMTAILAVMNLAYHRFLRVENTKLADEEALTKENLSHQAFHDELTGLPNRNMFRDRLRLAMADSTRYKTKCGVLFCDLDQFKVINDSLGHEAGDQTLITAAERLLSTVRKQDTVARFGGDEFAIIIQGMNQAIDAALLAEKLLDSISEPLVIGRKNHVLTASIGIAIFPDDSDEEEALLKHADTAMYQSKLHGRNTYRLFTEAMNEAAQERLAIEQGLKTGLMKDQFRIFYQPIFDLVTGQPVAYEALLRWNHPERGYISPVNFIDVAEQTGLILPIGKWVLETACIWASRLDPIGGKLPSISINLSSRQFRDPTLVQDVGRVLNNTGLDPSRLQLEITESMALTIDSTVATLRSLRSMGVKIAVDNFGTGYAALSLLQDLPMDIVKIDGSFVNGIEVDSAGEAILRAIVTMARALDYYVIAESVETETELNIYKQTQCDAAQGFFLCAPLSPKEFEHMTSNGASMKWKECGQEHHGKNPKNTINSNVDQIALIP
ncbi:MAG: EAL domain-containing protein [bacterium]